MSIFPGPTRLYLVRHARPEVHDPPRCRGRTDVGLAPSGIEQAARLGAAFAGLGLEAVYSSPLHRATATAAPIGAAAGVEVLVRPGLAEIDFGAFEDRAFDEIAASEPEVFGRWMAAPTTVRFPGGESFGEMRERALAVLGEITRRHPGGTVALVAHGGPIRAILGRLLRIPDRSVFGIHVAHAAATLVELHGDWPVLRCLNLPAEGLAAADRPAPAGAAELGGAGPPADGAGPSGRPLGDNLGMVAT
ncbi:MAG TPA: histidine phosphatase family protein [Candidatus Dormibacteraeota bacterium]|nr:histidine phosphatase family protein [Candidatus Dormibacteraeota bacterium]